MSLCLSLAPVCSRLAVPTNYGYAKENCIEMHRFHGHEKHENVNANSNTEAMWEMGEMGK